MRDLGNCLALSDPLGGFHRDRFAEESKERDRDEGMENGEGEILHLS